MMKETTENRLRKLCLKTLCTTMVLMLLLSIVPTFSVLADGFTYKITMSGAASGEVNGKCYLDVMEGQYVKFRITSEDDFWLYANVYGLAGTFTCETNSISAKEKEVTIRPVIGADFGGNNVLVLNFYNIDEETGEDGDILLATNNDVDLQGRRFSTNLSFDKSSLTLAVGQTYQLKFIANPPIDPYGNEIVAEKWGCTTIPVR